MKKITFNRPIEKFNNDVSYKIFIGKNVLTELKNGEEKTIEIPTEFDGKSIKAKMLKWWGSEEISLNVLSEKTTLKIKGNKYLNKKLTFILPILALTGPLMFGFGRENLAVKNIGIGLFFLILFFAVGLLTIGRNKWLIIEEY